MRRWKRAAEGGITIYCALAMAALLPLVLGAIVSVKVSAGRMQAANSVDQAMFSLFAHYDRQLARDYGLLFPQTSIITRSKFSIIIFTNNSSKPILRKLTYCRQAL